MEKSLTVIERGNVARTEFGATQTQTSGETSMAAVAAREQAQVQAEYVMAERHRRIWMDVRAAMLDHCARPRFSEICRYAKPVGKKKVNGEWVETYARGFTARFAETLRQEMRSVKPWSQVTYEDDLIRIVRIGVTDLEKNIPQSREVTFAKVVEKRGKKGKGQDEWFPPEGREVISSRLNSYGEPTFLVRATEDEMRSKVNSEESKTQRDFTLRLCPRDILEECEDRVTEVLRDGDQKDPLAALKRILDRYREFGILPGDLEQYVGKSSKQFAPADLEELRALGGAIRDGQTTFAEALKIKYSRAEDGQEVVGSVAEAAAVAEVKIAAAMATRPERPAPAKSATGEPPAMTDEENRKLNAEMLAAEHAQEAATTQATRPKPQFGRRS